MSNRRISVPDGTFARRIEASPVVALHQNVVVGGTAWGAKPPGVKFEPLLLSTQPFARNDDRKKSATS